MKYGRNSEGHGEADWRSMIGSVDVQAPQNYRLSVEHLLGEVENVELLPGSPFAIFEKKIGQKRRRE